MTERWDPVQGLLGFLVVHGKDLVLFMLLENTGGMPSSGGKDRSQLR